MLRVTYQNKCGKIQMGGSAKSGFPFNITNLVGFGMPGVELQTVTLANQPGITERGKRDTHRTLTISGVFNKKIDNIQKIYEILYHPGTLILNFNGKSKKIECRTIALEDFKRIGKTDLYNFVIQFQANYPYFSDEKETKVYVFSRENLNEEKSEGYEITLPTVFTARTSVKDINVQSEMPVYPIIYISNTTEETATYNDDTGIYVKNETTGAKIDLKYSPSSGETIIIDLENRNIKNQDGTILTNYISDDTVLADFQLIKGLNRISAINKNASANVEVYLVYSNEYISATY